MPEFNSTEEIKKTLNEEVEQNLMTMVDQLLHEDPTEIEVLKNSELTKLIEEICRLRDQLIVIIKNFNDDQLKDLDGKIDEFDEIYLEKIAPYNREETSIEESIKLIADFKNYLDSLVKSHK